MTTKYLSQLRRGRSRRTIIIESAIQTMPKGKDWQLFLCNSENKTELVRFLASFCKRDEFARKLKIPLIVTEEERTWSVTLSGIKPLATSNHHEADTRIVMEVYKLNSVVIVRAADTDIRILLAYAYAMKKPQNDWIMKIDKERHVSIRAIY